MVYCLRPTLLFLILAMTMVCVAHAEEVQQEGQPSALATMRESLSQYGEAGDAGQAGGGERAGSTSGSWELLYNCLDQLPQDQKIKASAIVSASLPRLQELDGQIHCKVDELQALTYSDEADPEALPKLGLDLQRLRNELRATLAAVNLRLLQEAGVQLQNPSGRGCKSMRNYATEPGQDTGKR